MQRLIDGIRQFQQKSFPSKKELFQRLAHGQQPSALLITCSDSRIDPNLLTQTHPGELFILRNAGNLVPPYGAGGSGEAATVEYAVSVLKVQDIIVCGHSHCGAMDGLLHPEQLGELPAVRSWLGHAEATARIVSESRRRAGEDAAGLAAAVERNVLVQLENLRTHPSAAAALSRGALKLHGWVYKFETGEVFEYHAEEGRFVAIS